VLRLGGELAVGRDAQLVQAVLGLAAREEGEGGGRHGRVATQPLRLKLRRRSREREGRAAAAAAAAAARAQRRPQRLPPPLKVAVEVVVVVSEPERADALRAEGRNLWHRPGSV